MPRTPTRYDIRHRRIKNIFETVVKDHVPNVRRISYIKINDPDSGKLLQYQPECAFRRKTSEHTAYYIVLEVIDAQSDHKTMADIARIVAEPGIRKAIFCSMGPKKKSETDCIVASLMGSYKDRFEKKRKKDIVDIRSIGIDPAYADDLIYEMLLFELKDLLPAESRRCL